MAEKSKIQWTDASWNPIWGCTKVSPGCAHCYIDRTPPFRKEGIHFKRVGNESTTGVFLRPQKLLEPLRWREPRRVFVNSLSDLFHEDVPDDYVFDVLGVMERATWHTFQVLTKRPERMLELVTRYVRGNLQQIDGSHRTMPNVWLGVSAENQHWADIRIPLLLKIPAAVHFVSAEPLLGPLDLEALLVWRCQRCNEAYQPAGGDWSWPAGFTRPMHRCFPEVAPLWADANRLDWLIIGGESGPKARRMQLQWAYDLESQCRQAGVAFFCKQLGTVLARELRMGDAKGGDIEAMPGPLRIREFPGLSSDVSNV